MLLRTSEARIHARLRACFRRGIFVMLLLKLSVKAALWRSLARPGPWPEPTRRLRQSPSTAYQDVVAEPQQEQGRPAQSSSRGMSPTKSSSSSTRVAAEDSAGVGSLELPRRVSLIARPAPAHPKMTRVESAVRAG